MANKCLIVFTKYPAPGKVKTRLAKRIGDKRATVLYKMFVEKTLFEADKTGKEIIVAVSESGCAEKYRRWLGNRTFIEQNGKDLGSRMKNAFSWAFKEGFEDVVLTGSDIPGLKASLIDRAFDKLVYGQPVLGPALDGGYYLIGFNKTGFVPEVFDNVSWSTDGVFRQTQDILKKYRLEPYSLQKLRDVDTYEDMKAHNIMKGGGNVGKLL
jgi:rSAM/selenodomain-associated transferase 1